MKIYNNYEKNLSLYESITRSRKRSIYLYFIIGSIFVIFLFFCPRIWYFYLIFGLFALALYILMGSTFYYMYRYPKKVKIFDEILEDYKAGKIIKELSHRGLKKDNLDCIISPYRYIRIAYIHNENIYTEIRLEQTRCGYASELTPNFVSNYTKKEIVSFFRKNISNYKYEDNKSDLKKKDFYNFVEKIFKDEEIIKDLSQNLDAFLEIKNSDN